MAVWFENLLERLMFRVMSVLSAKLEAKLELELAETRAELLTRASELGAETVSGLPVLAERLTETSTRMGQSDYLPAAHERAAFRLLEQEHHEFMPTTEPIKTTGVRPDGLPPRTSVPARPRNRHRPSRTASSKPVVPEAVDQLVRNGTELGGTSDGK